MHRYAYWSAIFLFIGLVCAKFSTETGFTSLIRFGESWQNRRVGRLQGLPIATAPNSYGYDGQFYAQLALDPLLLDSATPQALDVPAYRARRILPSAGASILGLGEPWWTLQAYALLNVACWIIFARLLRSVLPLSGGRTFARWFGCLFSMGVLESVRQSLVDLPLLVLLALAVAAENRHRPKVSAVWLALANLTKESGLIGTLAVMARPPVRPLVTRPGLLSFGVAVVPLALWACYVNFRIPASAQSSGMGNFAWPLAGLVAHLEKCSLELAAGNWDGRFSMGLLAALGFVLQAWTLWRTPRLDSGWWRVGAAYSILLLFLGPWVWSGYWAACRALLPMTIAFNLLLPGSSRNFWVLWAAGNATLLHAIWRFL
jgi:hypothetical protein